MTGQHQNIDADTPKRFSGKIREQGAYVMGYSDIQDIRDALPGNMADPERGSYLYWECIMIEMVDCGHRRKKSIDFNFYYFFINFLFHFDHMLVILISSSNVHY
jgi:hypothetical protein